MSRPSNDLSATNRAFLSLICAIVWLLVVPAFLLKGFCQGLRPQNNHRDQLSGADWGGETTSIPNMNIIHNDNAGAAK